jgi:cobalt-zinc-cadmium efflux system protein
MSDAHNHGHTNEQRMFIAALLTGGFMLAEVAGGLLSGSLALLADAGHMLTDFAALSLAWLAFRFSRWPADRTRTYGFDRLQVLVAFSSGLSLLVISGFIFYEAIRRLAEPVEVLGGMMLAVATAGLIVNLVVFAILHGADRSNLNVRAATIHVLGDLLGSVGAIAAAGIILTTGLTVADPLISMFVVALILRSAWKVIRESAHILLEGTPTGLALTEIKADLEAHVDGVEDVHHIHAWSITQERPMLTLHARLTKHADPEQAIAGIKARLKEHFRIDHTTIEIELDACADRSSARQAHG